VEDNINQFCSCL